MKIQFKPTDPNHPPDQRSATNLGAHLPGEIVGVGPDQEAEAQRLIENGEYVQTDNEPNSDEIAAALPKAMEKYNAGKAERNAAAAEAAGERATANANAASARVAEALPGGAATSKRK